MNRARKGARVERKLRDYLRCQEHEEAFVIRSAASKGSFDLVCFCPICCLLRFVTVKSNVWPGKAELEPLAVVAALNRPSIRVDVLAARWKDRAPAPEIVRVQDILMGRPTC